MYSDYERINTQCGYWFRANDHIRTDAPQSNPLLFSTGPGAECSVGHLLPGGEAVGRVGKPMTALTLVQGHDSLFRSHVVCTSW